MGDNVHSGGATTLPSQDLVSIIIGLQQQLQQMEERRIDDIRRLKDELTNLPREPPLAQQQPAQPATVETASPPAGDPMRRPRPKLTDPEAFDGQNRSLYRQFRSKLRAKLEVDKEALGNAYDRMWYAFGRLTGEAAMQVLPWMERFAEKGATESKLDGMLDQMDFIFLDRNLKEKAVRDLASLKQNNKPFTTFLTEFNRLLMEADGHDWPESTKRSYLDNALNREMNTRLETVEKKDGFEDYCRQLQLIADRMEKNQLRYPRNNNSQRGTRPHPLTSHNNRAVTAPSAHAVNTAHASSPPQDMDWEPTTTTSARNQPRRVAKRVSQEEIERRRREQRCLRCGDSTHFISRCPYDSPKSSTSVARTHVHGPELEDENEEQAEEQSGSGKEQLL